MPTRLFTSLCFIVLVSTGVGCDSQPVSVSDERSSTPNQDSQNLQVPSFHIPSETTLDEPSARRLFDGKTLTGWESTNFGGEGEVVVSDGTIQLAMGYPMTGITATSEELPTDHYEISLDAMRVDGTDFFCGLTFPVEASYCSLIVGGWGGTLVGLSSIDGKDAANNDTMLHMNFENGQWYHLRVRIADRRVSVWIDDQQVIDEDLKGKELSLRNEILPSRPLGICGFQSECAIKNILLKPVGSGSPVSPSNNDNEPLPVGGE
ncbi:MAG: DUF1080 domain-containing protein [Mariniblastus sp.]|nr:DUF1080 domain-containing protein [Mariniblastus sp.]